MPLKVEKKDFEKEYQEKGSYHEDLKEFKKFFFETNYKLLAEGVRETNKVLDVACGEGELSNYLPTDDIIGIDNAPTAIKLAKESGRKGQYLVMDMQDLKFDENSFDVVICSLSLFYFDKSNIDKVLQEIKKVLKPDGRFVFSYKNLEHPKIQNYISKLDETMEAFSLNELKEILKKNNFKIEKVVGTNLFLDTENVSEEKLNKIYELSKKLAYYLPKESYHFIIYTKIEK